MSCRERRTSLRFVWKKRKNSIVDLKALVNDIKKFFSLNFIFSSAESILQRQNLKISSIKQICILLPDFLYATETKPFSLRFVWKKRKFSIVDLKALINDIEKFFSLNFIYSSAESILHHQNFKIPSIKQICILLPDFLYATETTPFSLRFVWKKRKFSIVDLKALINDIKKFFSLNFI